MKATVAAIALVGSVLANPAPQAVTSAIAPVESTPSECSDSAPGEFLVTTVNVTSSSKRDFGKRQASALELTLSNGILKDSKDRTGYIAANFQYVFDGSRYLVYKLT
jgi:hypothetical protein